MPIVDETGAQTRGGGAGASTASVPLPCPDCDRDGFPGSRVGNRRRWCRSCNAFAAAVRRRLLIHLEDTYGTPTLREELEIEEYLARFGGGPA